MRITLNNSYAALPHQFYEKIVPTPVRGPELVCFNAQLADELNITDTANDQEIAEFFSGNKLLSNSVPIATVYAGHQFGHFVPVLGDGRAVLLGDTVDQSHQCREIQLKGAGKTSFSRQGDGRAALGPMLREYMVSEAMHYLGIKTTRSLAVVTTGEKVVRETMQPGAILTRISQCYVRVGTFEYFFSQNDLKSVRLLADYIIDRQYPEIKKEDNPYFSFLKSVCINQVLLIIEWMRVGFIHGVMNTDNVSICGETIDYGPCAFMDDYHPQRVFSAIDYFGRYAFNSQPAICFWNLRKFAITISSLIDEDLLNAEHLINKLFTGLGQIFQAENFKMMCSKIGIVHANHQDYSLLDELFYIMEEEGADFTLTFRYLGHALIKNIPPHWKNLFSPSLKLNEWIKRWIERLHKEKIPLEEIADNLFKVNPAYVPRNHQIERAIHAAVEKKDFSIIEKFNQLLTSPYIENEDIQYMQAPTLHEKITKTFCGT